MSITGEAGGERCHGSSGAPSIYGKLGTPAMSLASRSALFEEPMVGEGGRGTGDLLVQGQDISF